jgi:hypothetical protein
MGATSITGVGQGSSEGSNKGPGNNRTIYQTINGPSIVAAGRIENDGCWQVLVTLANELPGSPDSYAIFVTQTDWYNDDGRSYRPPHTEKIDQYGHNLGYYWDENGDPIWASDSKLKQFVLHVGDDGYHRYEWVIMKIGGIGSDYDPCNCGDCYGS